MLAVLTVPPWASSTNFTLYTYSVQAVRAAPCAFPSVLAIQTVQLVLAVSSAAKGFPGLTSL